MDIPTAEARKQFSEILNRAAYAKERVVLTRRGKALAAVAPTEDIGALEAIEDRIAIEEADKALALNEKPIPLAEFNRKCGLK